jgi:hypothetical protein
VVQKKDFSSIFSPKFFFKTTHMGVFYARNRLRAFKNREIASLTHNKSKKSYFCDFLAISKSGKRFHDFSILAIDFIHRKTPYMVVFEKFFTKICSRNPVFFAHPVLDCSKISTSYKSQFIFK